MSTSPWWTYVQTELDRRRWSSADLASAAGISHTRMTRWREGTTPSIETARAIARAFDAPLLTVLVAAGLITAEEAGQDSAAPATPADLTDEQLAAEVLRRMRHGGERPTAPTLEEIEASPDRFEVIQLPGKQASKRPAQPPHS